jgi:hypothetical protein
MIKVYQHLAMIGKQLPWLTEGKRKHTTKWKFFHGQFSSMKIRKKREYYTTISIDFC